MARVVDADAAGVAAAAEALGRGELVAFPTETVYGLGGLALRPGAVQAIFAAKGRPSTNPLIVHVLDLEGAAAVAREIPARARALAAAFWPGPLTLVLPRGPGVPDEVTAGGPTVALRAPAHPAARALLAALGQPVAAPSANRSSGVSPTTAAHVLASQGDRISLILDGGPCAFGIESTVLDLTDNFPKILRPGSVSREALAEVLGVLPGAPGDHGGPGPLRSPGLLTRHYAPRARVALVPPAHLDEELARQRSLGGRVAALTLGQPRGDGMALPDDPDGYARGLYGALHDLDARFDAIVIELPPLTPPWEAVHDRLRRSAATV